MEFNKNKVRGLMSEYGYTQKEFAKELNITDNSVRNKLQGKTEFTVSELATMIMLFKVSADVFFKEKVELEATNA